MSQLKEKILNEFNNGILSYWKNITLDNQYGGFQGLITNTNNIIPEADKGLIQNTRNLWSFSKAYNSFGDKESLELANRAKEYILKNFWDKENGGFYWLLNYKGDVINNRKQIYGQAFSIYALSEYFIATKDKESLDYAKKTFELIEKYSLDNKEGGYFEALDDKWNIIEDFRLSSKDLNEPKSNNTHLHLMEAYTTFYKVNQTEEVLSRLKNVTDIMLNKIMNKRTLNFTLFFDEQWNSRSDVISYGHEIEASWLIYEALLATKDLSYINENTSYVINIAENCYKNYLDGKDGKNGIFNEEDGRGVIDKDKVWWVQAEACVGFYLAYQLTGKEYFYNTVENIWTFIETYIVDKDNGEWFEFGTDNTTKSIEEYKISNWKSFYHNGRACIELIERIK